MFLLNCHQSLQNSVDELKEMMLCLQHYCAVFNSMEEQLDGEQAVVYRLLSDQDRYVFVFVYRDLLDFWSIDM